MLRMSGSIQKSTEVMAAMRNLIKLPEIQATMMELSREMSKAGLMEEMMEDTFEGLEDDDLEEEADKEVDKILWEVTNGVCVCVCGLSLCVCDACVMCTGQLGVLGPVSSKAPDQPEVSHAHSLHYLPPPTHCPPPTHTHTHTTSPLPHTAPPQHTHTLPPPPTHCPPNTHTHTHTHRLFQRQPWTRMRKGKISRRDCQH